MQPFWIFPESLTIWMIFARYLIGKRWFNMIQSLIFETIPPTKLLSFVEISNFVWLVVWTPLKNISQLRWLFPIYGKNRNVPNHQPVVEIYKENCCFTHETPRPWMVMIMASRSSVGTSPSVLRNLAKRTGSEGVDGSTPSCWCFSCKMVGLW